MLPLEPAANLEYVMASPLHWSDLSQRLEFIGVFNTEQVASVWRRTS